MSIYNNDSLTFIENIHLYYMENENKYYVDFGSRKAYLDEKVGLILLGLKRKNTIKTIRETLNNTYEINLTSNEIIDFIEKK